MDSANVSRKRTPSAPAAVTGVRTGAGVDAIAQDVIDNMHCLLARLPEHASRHDWYQALAYAVRDRLMGRYIQTAEAMTATRRASRSTSIAK